MRAFLFVCAIAVVLASCAPAPRLDPTPFVCPSPLLRLQSGDPAGALASVRDDLESEGFVTDSLDATRLSMVMSRRTSARREAYDRFLIWMERDRDDPLEYVQVYVTYGRFIPVVGSGEPIRRQWVDPVEEAGQLRTIRDILAVH